MASCQVRVAVRIRPLTPQEVGQGDNQVVEAIAPTVGIGERKFTYDAVFDSHVTQPDLYASVSGPLLNSFLDGYNATIMAYGQTGSGKTFTMGSEAHADGEDMCLHPGLIPRFMSDVFANLEQRKSESDAAQNESALLEYRVSASFLEVYGEDVHDLLDKDRKTLPLRENANGGVVVQGLTSRSVSNTDEALNVLHEGTLNRTTAATLMNLHSSRSHAVFTVHLQQTNRTSNGGDLDVTTTSCFTFVDLAGSERMKKTGAEGERAKEGIKINEGLLALGNVINALADEQRLAKEKKIHVPYRQSKLTRLLQDALGGNSQTLFLACVSPADSNASETLSTLHYANRARNIKNAPTKNVDASVAELQRLHALTHVLQSELVKSRFGHAKSSDEIGHVDENLMNQQNVKDYLESLHRAAEAHQGAVVPLKSQTSSSGFGVAFNSTTVAPFGPLKTPMKNNSTGDAMTPGRAPLGEKSVNRTQYLLDEGDDLLLDEVNPDEEMAILDQLLELQHHDNEYEKKHKSNEEHLKEVEGELEEQEGMLLQLKESLKVYHTLKARYEVLMGEVQQLEAEKKNLAEQLEKAVVDPSKGCSLAIKKKLEKVEISLARARSETRKHQQKYRKAEQQAQKSKTLERKIVELKKAKVAMIKKQKESAARHREYTESKTREIMALKRKERTAGQKVSKLEAEIKIHKNNLEKRKDYSIKLSSKLKQTESHLMKLLAMRKKELHHRSSVPTPARKRNVLAPAPRGIPRKHASPTETFAAESNETKSIVFLLDKAVAELVSKSQTKRRYEERIAEYSDTMRELIAEVNLLKEAKKKRQETNSDEVIEEIHSREQNVEDLELKLELVGCDLETLKSNLPSGEEASTLSLDSDVAVTKVLASVDAPKLRTVFKEVISKFADSEVERQRLAEGLQRKESTLESFNMEVDSLNNKINTLTNEIDQRRAMSESGDGHFEKIEKLTAEKARLSEELHGAQARVTKLTMEVANLKDKAAERFREKSDFKEKLIVAEAIAKQHSEAHPSEPILTKLQGIWKDLGVSEIYREDAQRKIDTCLEDTCNRVLEEASKLKANTIAEINRLENELTSMSSVLGKDPPPVIDVKANGVTLLPLCESLREEASKIRPEYLSAVERRMNLVNDARTLVDAIGREKAQPSSKLTELIEGQEKQGSSIKSGREQRAEVLRNVQGMVDSLDRLMGSDSTEDHEMESITEPSSPLTDDYNYGPPRSLHVDVLDSCEKEVSRLRLLKSEILVQNSEVREEIAALVKDMHLSADEIVALTEQVVDFQNENTSAWWATDVALQVARSLLDNESCVLTTPAFSKHLDSIRLAMETVAAHRRSLSQALKGAVDRAQKTLLMTVDGETGVSEAYASFHDALFQLPSLSKEHVDACIAELNALVAGVDAMRQSEVEALTVVWEALDVRPNQRSSFWSKLEEDTTQMQLTDENLFDSVRSVESRYKESWVVKATNEAHKVYADLSMRLFKLESIHRSVETLRTRQDAKSRIISLDSEIRILSAKLGDFEDKRCSKSRLLTKKTGSGALLKEERFRKQMQTKFTSKLEQLARLLRIWIETEGESFDANLLSDEVRNLLDNADCMETYVESRTVRMHLNLKTHSTSATSNGKRSRPEMRTTRSRSDESRSWSPNRPNTSRTGSRDGPSPPASRPRKVARTGRCAIAAPSPQHDGSKSISRSATNKRKAEVRSKSPIKPKIRRTGRDGASTLLLSPSPQENGQAMRMDKPKRGASTRARESQSIMPFGNLLAESEKISSPTFSSSLHSTQGKENY